MFDSQVFTEKPADSTKRYKRAFVQLRIMAISAVSVVDSWDDLFRPAKVSGPRFAFISGTVVLGVTIAVGLVATKQFGVSRTKAWLLAIGLFAFGEAVSDTIAFYRAKRQTGLADASVSDGGVSVQRSHE
jgi:hypothetical protein